jgi:hypothetical protein
MNESIKEGMYIIATTCYKCEKPMNVAVTYRNNGFRGPEGFSAEEKNIATNHEVIIEHRYSGTRQDSYDANICPHCNAFMGQHFLFPEYSTGVMYGDFEFKFVDIK